MAMQGIEITASAEEPAVVGSYVLVGDDVFDGGVVDPPPTSEDERGNEGAVLGDEEDDLSDEDHYFSSDDEDDDTDDEDVDMDSEFEEDDEVPKVKNGDVAAATCKFLGQPARIATVQSTVCFMKLTTSSAPLCQCQCHHGCGGEIIVDYRYTRFLRTQSGGGDGDGVDMHILGPKQARLRFVLPSPLASASDPVTTTVSSSLRFAGAVLASLVYPARFSAQLQTLWSVTTVPVLVPARATCLLVTVDVGILRPGDFTPARMMRMCEALESVAGDHGAVALPTPFEFDIATELHLPALLRSEDDVRPTKRRRVTGEDCPICCEVLKEGGGLAAWPRCSHIFHSGCLEQHLLTGYQECPLCRSELKLSPTPCGK
ncbi:unnamed protein product [Miscanthus lutarioriparius]|uniref:RING-type domain-containing protein n=1 Tax=Miscanthus lutarioriparius TaxID=422564 RepID=A0A811QJB5_9POAL|nr:unnamed protein product [Miscanthus lutarioriparius]